MKEDVKNIPNGSGVISNDAANDAARLVAEFGLPKTRKRPAISKRRGTFKVSWEFLRWNMDAMLPVMARMVVTDVIHSFSEQTITYCACSDQFEEIDDAVCALEYEFVFRTENGEPTFEVKRTHA